ncbi:TetR/AcrR family transcriptional regulator [Shewanella inventionis]|uniref:TetR family transcriptional regulator n=1 Tax=Shewanella inventionis TaxID=1738770 RepID=A0ABQ1IYN2_9GAMM|nr:TetR/AcrR family transcriptional regulator [Shewanella inventionis]MCL1157114.1 TetR/AcrR family transcriptional regulator [Shewanella inventionis]UAL44467.1 TetR/AcrR family transcriptional regulator [Shewanella inventionis]GGB55332.1 TetR family transcriptional regulator [Shewanella inventionis]
MNLPNTKPRRGRPPKVSRENPDTRAALIRSGLEQLTEHGFAASGIEPILKKVGVPKGSFYHYFASKEAFGQVVLQHYADYFLAKLTTHLQDETTAPLTRIRHFVADAKAGMTRHHFKRGCLVGNLGQEVGMLPESFRPQLIAIFERWQDCLAHCLADAAAQGQIAADADCQLLAENFWVAWEGAVSRAKLVENGSPLDNFCDLFIAALPK